LSSLIILNFNDLVTPIQYPIDLSNIGTEGINGRSFSKFSSLRLIIHFVFQIKHSSFFKLMESNEELKSLNMSKIIETYNNSMLASSAVSHKMVFSFNMAVNVLKCYFHQKHQLDVQ
jgi:hypothetical protein